MSQKENELSSQSSGKESEPVKILLAEDDKEDQELFEEALKKTGEDTKLTVVDNGKELVNNLKDKEQENPDIIFLDVNMPVKDGIVHENSL